MLTGMRISGPEAALRFHLTEAQLVTEEELMEQLMMPEVEYEDDGSVWVYWLDQKIDITDKFEDGVCYVKLVSGEETKYVTVQYQNGYAVSDHKYAEPDTWGCE